MRRRRMAYVAVALGFAVALAVAEIGARVLFRYNTPHTVRENSLQYEPSVFARHVLRPGQEVDHLHMHMTGGRKLGPIA